MRGPFRLRHTLQHARELLRAICVELVLDVVVKLFHRPLLRGPTISCVSYVVSWPRGAMGHFAGDQAACEPERYRGQRKSTCSRRRSR